NAGILDQIAVLRWVRDHIEAFGGDPDNVTVFGESAGATSVLCLLCAPDARGLFRRAIVQSASFTQLRSAETAAERAARVLAHLELDPTSLHRLRELPLERLMAAQTAMLAGGSLETFQHFSP